MGNKFPSYKRVSVDQLIPYARNSRTHSDEQVSQIAASIKEFGFLNPIITDGENGIVAGHGRVLAAQKLGMQELPVIEADHLTDAQKQAYIIADNKLALNAGWDNEILAIEFSELYDAEFDVSLTGFDEQEIANIIDEPQPPPLKAQEYQESFSIVIDCEDEAEQEKLFNRLNSEGYKCRVQSL